jgi:PIN domain nuclease of toxin-antitoxin system
MPQKSESPSLLLETHVWIWFMLANAELAVSGRTAINRAAASGELRIAAISLWEVALLASRGRIALRRPLARWVREAVSVPWLSIEPLLPHIAVECCTLPEAFHRDPADRLIVATGRVIGAALMTRDRRILEYAARGQLTTIVA